MNKKKSSLTIYFNSGAIHLSEELPINAQLRYLKIEKFSDVSSFFDKYLKGKDHYDCILYGLALDKLLRNIQRYFNFVEAAGGLVSNNENKYLFIERLGFWDLPKGKVEKKESALICAFREVEEETAVTGLKVITELSPTYHIYSRNEKYYLKKTYWFLMKTTSDKPLVPQSDEEITQAVWLDKQQSVEALNKSYRSLKDTFLDFIRG